MSCATHTNDVKDVPTVPSNTKEDANDDEAAGTDYEYSDYEYAEEEEEEEEEEDDESDGNQKPAAALQVDNASRKCPPSPSMHEDVSPAKRTRQDVVAFHPSVPSSRDNHWYKDDNEDDAFYHNVQDFTCPLCATHVEGGDGVILPDCQHSICVDCLNQFVTVQIEEGFPQASSSKTNVKTNNNKRGIDTTSLIACPAAQSCGIPIPRRVLVQMLPPELQLQLQRSSCSYLVANDPCYHHCPTPNCENVVYWKEGVGPPVADCFQCQKTACLQCGATPYHTAFPTCQAFRESVKHDLDNNHMTDGYIASIRGRKCGRCSAVIIKESGCNKMKCRCGYKFCFGCGTENANCDCTPVYHGYIDNFRGTPDFSGILSSRSFRLQHHPPFRAAAAAAAAAAPPDVASNSFAYLPMPPSRQTAAMQNRGAAAVLPSNPFVFLSLPTSSTAAAASQPRVVAATSEVTAAAAAAANPLAFVAFGQPHPHGM